MTSRTNLSSFLTRLFGAFEQEGIALVILRGYRALPEQLEGTDLDILVDRKSFEIAVDLIRRIADTEGFRTLPTIIRQYVRSVPIFYFGNLHNHLFLKFDVHVDHHWFSARYLTAEEVISNARPYRSFRIPCLGHEAILCFLSSYLSGGFVKPKYRDLVLQAYREDKAEIERVFENAFGPPIAARLLEVFDSENLERALVFRPQVLRSLVKRRLIREPIHLLRTTAKFAYCELRLRLCPPGASVAIVGPDGAGKSTVAGLVAKTLRRLFVSDCTQVIHWRPAVLPSLRALLPRRIAGNTNPDPVVTNPHGSKPSGFTFSLVRLFYYACDFWVGYWPAIGRPTVKNGLVVFDRYGYDFLVDPRRSRIALPRGIRNAVTRFLPSPDFVIYLDAPAHVLRSRKPELELNELDRQVAEFRLLVSRLPNAYTVDATRPLPDVASDVIRIILAGRRDEQP